MAQFQCFPSNILGPTNVQGEPSGNRLRFVDVLLTFISGILSPCSANSARFAAAKQKPEQPNQSRRNIVSDLTDDPVRRSFP